jgi:cell wall-associated NlpC family hydrolase
MTTRPASRILIVLTCLPLAALLLACITLPWEVSQGAVAQSVPRWACPTPTPKPYGDDGPIKGYHDGQPDPTTGIPEQVPDYYVIWEQEYGNLGNPPPAPTPYTKSGYGFYLGQIVNLSPSIDVQGDVRKTEVVSGSLRLYEAKLTWQNRGEPFPFSAARQVVLSAVQRSDGARLSGSGWSWSLEAARLAGRPDDQAILQSEVPAGDTETVVPLLAPDGDPQTLDLQLDLTGQAGNVDSGGLRVQWSRAQEPYCDHAGTLAASYNDPAQPVQGPPPPANATDIVAWVYSQIGRPYCWGGKGNAACAGNPGVSYADACPDRQGLPCWDCSGLTWGAYKSVGVTIGHGTSNQSRYPAVWQAGSAIDPASVAQPGDLLLFTGANANGRPVGSITHVGLYAGDGVMVHAANYPDGVLATPNVFTNHYYKPKLVMITRPSRN